MSTENKPARRAVHTPRTLDTGALQARALELAGVTLEELGAMMHQALATMKAAMEAEKVTPLLWEGELRGEHKTPDWSIRVKASSAVIKLTQDVTAAQEAARVPERPPLIVTVNIPSASSSSPPYPTPPRNVTPPDPTGGNFDPA